MSNLVFVTSQKTLDRPPETEVRLNAQVLGVIKWFDVFRTHMFQLNELASPVLALLDERHLRQLHSVVQGRNLWAQTQDFMLKDE